MLLAQEGADLFLGEDFFPWMVLALGAAMVVGNVLALLRPPVGSDGSPSDADTTQRPRPPLLRSVVFIVAGLAAAGWGLASLLA